MNGFLRTDAFDAWLKGLRDPVGRARVIARIRSAELGNFSDCAPVGAGVMEMRIHSGPGYRVYYARTGNHDYLLLVGGRKGTQQRDIAKAKAMLRDSED